MNQGKQFLTFGDNPSVLGGTQAQRTQIKKSMRKPRRPGTSSASSSPISWWEAELTGKPNKNNISYTQRF